MKLEELYDRYHNSRKKQKRVVNKNDFTYAHIIALLTPCIKTGDKALDIGCGTGTVSLYLAKNGMKTKGTDISKNAIKTSRQNAVNLGLDKKVNFSVLKFPEQRIVGKFNLIVLSEVLEHIVDEKKAVDHLVSLMDTKGIALITVPSYNAPLYKLGLLSKFDKEVGHLRRYDEGLLKKLLQKKGVKIVSLTKSEGIMRNFLFTNQTAGKLVKYINRLIPTLFNFLDSLTVPLLGESDIQLIIRKS